MHVYLDIETIPAQAPWVREELAASVRPPANLKKPESINTWLEENRESEADAAWLKTSFDGGLGQIVCIAWAIDGGQPTSVSVCDLSHAEELAIIGSFFSALHFSSGRRPVLVGHNIIGFDLPFIWKRAIVHGARPPVWFPRDQKPWGESVIDTMAQWSGARGTVSMDRLCRILGLEGKGDGPTGADVWPMVQAGKFSDVAAYCRADVERTRALHKRMTFEMPAGCAA